MSYPISKPAYPVTAKVLAAAVLLGLAGLGLVAYEVFRIMDSVPVAIAFALVIELGAISEALSMIRKNRPAMFGLLVSVLVSGVYNYTRGAQASASLATPLGDVQLIALALGPLSATLFLALSLGHELKEYDRRVQSWQARAAQWHLDRETEQQRAALASQERIEKARIRAQARVNTRVITQNQSVITQPEVKGTYQDFVTTLRERNGSGPLSVEEIQERFGVSRKTAYNWINKRAAETQDAPAINSN